MRPHGHRPRRCLRVRGGEEGRQPGGGPGVEAMAPSKARWLMVSHCPPHAGPPGAQLPGPALGFHGRIPTCRSSPSPSQLCCPGGSRQEMGVSTAQRCGRRPLPSPSPPPHCPQSRGSSSGHTALTAGMDPPPRGPAEGGSLQGMLRADLRQLHFPAGGGTGGGGRRCPPRGTAAQSDVRQREPNTHVALGHTQRSEGSEKCVPGAEERLSAPRSP